MIRCLKCGTRWKHYVRINMNGGGLLYDPPTGGWKPCPLCGGQRFSISLDVPSPRRLCEDGTQCQPDRCCGHPLSSPLISDVFPEGAACDGCGRWFEADAVERVAFEDGDTGFLCDHCFEAAEIMT